MSEQEIRHAIENHPGFEAFKANVERAAELGVMLIQSAQPNIAADGLSAALHNLIAKTVDESIDVNDFIKE